jgi:lipopolysaccharide transport system ATP-binding protein
MPASVISVENLSKCYLVGHRAERYAPFQYKALRDVLGREIRNAARKAIDVVRGRQVVEGDSVEEFWALKDVNFEVDEGDILGIIGHNGAGKSTLLKILSRITEPTAGRVTLRGRVASLLEVGTGFHPELSGRENIYLNGAVLGMSRAEIRKKFDEIVAFAEVEQFLDTPVKRYSSGMYVRLAFAVAAHLEPEILIVDEVLAVGDAEFQKKCLGKMEEVSRREGRTVLFVSHNMTAITNLCRKALWLDRGIIREEGPPQEVIDQYLAHVESDTGRVILLGDRERAWVVNEERLRFTALEWLTPLPLQNSEPARLRLHFEARAPLRALSAIVGFNSIAGGRVLTFHMGLEGGVRRQIEHPGKYSVDLAIDSLSLGPDYYNVDVSARSGDLQPLDFIAGCSQIEVVAGPNTSAAIAQKHPGVRLEGDWSWARTEQPSELDVTL